MAVAFEKFGVKPATIKKRLGRKLDTMTTEDLSEYIGIYNSLQDGNSVVSDWFDVKLNSDRAKDLTEKLLTEETGEQKMQSKLQGGSIIVCGYVPKDAELKTVGEKGSSLCRWSVKVDEKINGDQKEAVWANCQAWHDIARYAASIKKGDTVLCVGQLETNTGTDGKVYKNLVCEFVSIMKSVPKASPIAPIPETSEVTDLSEYEELLSDGETPF